MQRKFPHCVNKTKAVYVARAGTRNSGKQYLQPGQTKHCYRIVFVQLPAAAHITCRHSKSSKLSYPAGAETASRQQTCAATSRAVLSLPCRDRVMVVNLSPCQAAVFPPARTAWSVALHDRCQTVSCPPRTDGMAVLDHSWTSANIYK